MQGPHLTNDRKLRVFVKCIFEEPLSIMGVSSIVDKHLGTSHDVLVLKAICYCLQHFQSKTIETKFQEITASMSINNINSLQIKLTLMHYKNKAQKPKIPAKPKQFFAVSHI